MTLESAPVPAQASSRAPEQSLVVLDREGRVVHANDVARRFAVAVVGRDIVIGDVFANYSAENALEEYLTNLALALAGEVRSGRRTLRYSTGIAIEFVCFYEPIFVDEEVCFVHLSAIDVTSAALERERLELYGQALDQTTSGVVICNARSPAFPITFVNAAFVRMTGYAAEDVLGRSCSFLQGEDSQPSELAIVRETLRTGGSCEVTLRNYRKDGTQFFNRLALSPIREADGSVIYYIGIQQDVTADLAEQRRAEEAARRRALRGLAGGVVHEFSNVLGAIVAHVDLIAADAAFVERNPETVGELADVMARARTLTGRLLAFAQPEQLVPVTFDLAERVEAQLPALRRIAPAGITVELRAHPATVRLDPRQLDQVLVELVANAATALGTHGSISITVGQIESPTGPLARVRVADDGPGGDVQRFAGAEPVFSTKEGRVAMGLGLPTCRAIAESAGGLLRIESASEKGTVCTIELPLATGGVGLADVAKVARGGGRLLLVDDDAAVRRVIARVLRLEGYEVAEACTAREAIALLETVDFDVLVTDVLLPDGGPELPVVAAYRRRRPRGPVVVATGFALDLALDDHGEGPIVVLLKPFGVKELLARLRHVLSVSRAHA